jgi:peroxiredoxin
MRSLGLLLPLLIASPLVAGEYNKVLSIGDAAPAWKDLPGVDGQTHSLADLKQELVVVVFTCSSCPIATDYEDRIIALANKYADRVGVVAINVNLLPEDSLPEMKKRSDAKQFPFPYLFDETQQIAKDYGALFTPEFFVLNKERKVVYMGGMDDSSLPKAVKSTYLQPAIEALLTGAEPSPQETVARGCLIRYVRERRQKSTD